MSRFLQFFLKGAWPRAWLRLTLAAGAAIGVPFISVYPVLRKFLIKFSGPAHRSRLNALMDPVRPISLERCTLPYCTVLVTPHHHHYATLRLAPLRRIALLHYPTCFKSLSNPRRHFVETLDLEALDFSSLSVILVETLDLDVSLKFRRLLGEWYPF